MDIEREMERLASEARKKLEEERGAQEAAREERARVDVGGDALKEAQKLARSPEAPVTLGQKMAIVLVGLVAVWGVWTFVVGPLLSIALTLAILGLVVFGIVKLIDAVGGDDDPPPS
jgi:hypothetical protein